MLRGAHGEITALSSETYHEPYDKLSALTKDMHRALVSLGEELQAIDWYQQRVDASEDEELKRVLAHNRDEEKEHAAMVLEWIRRRDPVFAGFLHTYLFKREDIVAIEEAAEEAGGQKETETRGPTLVRAPRPALTVGSLMITRMPL